MNVCVMGLGYIGFPTACLVARAGHQVVGVDVNRALISRLRQGELHIVNEEGLESLAHSVMQDGRLHVGLAAVPADVFIIAVPTPFTQREEATTGDTPPIADLRYVAAAIRSILPVVQPGNLIILESTVPPHTMGKVVLSIFREAGKDPSLYHFAHAPERVLPGNIVQELVRNDRIVGGVTPEAGQVAQRFYKSFVEGTVVVTDATTAELVKLMENTFRDVNIALANEFARVCEHLGTNVWEAIRLANLHPRVNFLRPGPGVGGHCIAVDPYFVVEAAPTLTPLIQVAREVNRRMPLHVVDLFREMTKSTPVRKVAVLGASYKANVGDDRESPSLEVAHLLAESRLEVAIHDPYVDRYSGSVADVLADADAVLLLTDHKVYTEIDPKVAANLMAHKLLLETRGLLDVAAWRAAGFQVVQIGSSEGKEVAVGV